MELHEVIQSLTRNEGFPLKNTEWLARLGVFTVGIFAALIICLLLVAVFSSLSLNVGAALVFMMILFGITFGFLANALFANYQLKKEKSSRREHDDYSGVSQIERWNTNKQLRESTLAPIQSVTENTTDLFYVERMKPKTSGELS